MGQEITLTPQSYLLTLDGADLLYPTWEKVVAEISRQISIHNCHYALTCIDAGDEATLERFFFHRDGAEALAVSSEQLENPAALTEGDELALPVRPAILKYQDWELFIKSVESRSLFRSLRQFTQNAEVVAEGNHRRFEVQVLGLNPSGEAKTLTFGEEEPETATDDTGSFVAQLAAQRPVQQEELPPRLISPASHAPLPQEPEEAPEESTAPNGAVEPTPEEAQAPEVEAVSEVEEEAEEAEPQPQPIIPAPEPVVFAPLPVPQEEPAQKKPKPKVKNPLKGLNLKSKKVIIPLGISATILLAAVAGMGIHALTDQPPQSMTQSAISDTGRDLPEGYSNQPAWTTPIPQDAEVMASSAALAIIKGQTITLHSLSNGQAIDTVESSWAIGTIDETLIDKRPALIWLDQAQTKLTSWQLDAEGKPKTQSLDLPEGAEVSKISEEIMIQTKDKKVYRLTSQGLTPYQTPEGLTPFAFAPDGLISIGYDVPVEITDPEGKALRSINIASPAEGYAMSKWVAVSSSVALSIWSQQLDATAASTPVLLVTHSLATGEVLDTEQTTLGAVDMENSWSLGQSNRLAIYQNRIFSLTDGKYISSVPANLATPTARGNLVTATDADTKKQYVFSGEEAGYVLNQKYLLAQTGSLIITQSGNRAVAYPATLS